MKYALITGATSGIGIALARVFARKKYNLVLVSSSEENLRRTRKSFKRRFADTDVFTICEDLSQKGSAQRVYNKVKEKGIEIDILVNNAGFGLVGDTTDIDIDEDEKMLYLNMITPTCLCKLFLKDMYKKGCGSILNVASVGAFQPGPYTSTYFASKSYLYSYSRAIRFEAKKHGVNVCVLCPGTTRTQFFKKEGKKTPVWAMPAGKLAEYTVEQFEKNKAVIVPGMINRVMRFVPSGIKSLSVAIMKK